MRGASVSGDVRATLLRCACGLLRLSGLIFDITLGAVALSTPEGFQQIGRFGKHRENTAGMRMREFLQDTSLVAVNTLYKYSAGNTWFYTRGQITRIDYIFTCPTAACTTKSIYVQQSLGYRLQLPNTAFLSDHCPIVWTFSLPCTRPGTRSICLSRNEVASHCSSPSCALIVDSMVTTTTGR